MVSFELGKGTEKDLLCLVTSIGQRKTSESPEELNLRPSDSVLQCSTTELDYVEQGFVG